MHKNYRAQTLRALGVAAATLFISGGVVALPASAHAREVPSLASQLEKTTADRAAQFLLTTKEGVDKPAVRAGRAAQEAARHLGVEVMSLTQKSADVFLIDLEKALTDEEVALFLTSLRADASVELAVSEADAGLQSTFAVSPGSPDMAAPVLVSSSVDKTSLNLADGPVVVKATVRLTDQSGAKAPTVILSHSATGQQQGFGSMSLVSGTAQDGVWERTMTIPLGSATGQWDVTLYPLGDVLGNSGGGFKTLATLNVLGAVADISAPVLVSSSVDKTSFNLADGPVVVKATVRLTDQSGAKAPTVILSHSATGQQQGFGSMSLVSGTAQDGVWERTMTIPLGSATGQWDVTLYPLGDVLGNSGGGFKTLATLDVTGAVADISAPVVVNSSVNKSSFNLFDGPAVVKASVRVVDQTGAKAPTVILSHSETWQQQGFGSMSLVSGTPQDGVWERTMTIPEWSATGKWDVTLYPLSDNVGNSGGGFRTVATIDVLNEAPRTPVTPAAVSFADKDGTKDDTYTVPATTGVEYLVGGKVVAAGTYPGAGTVTVTARATADYVLAAGAVASWTGTFKATPFIATPAAVSFADKDGTKDDTYTVPATTGVEYLVGGKVVAAGTYPGTGTVTVTARATADYVLAAGAVASWTGTFKATPFIATPAAVSFTDKDGTKDDTYTVPATTGVEYLVGGKVVAAGTYPGTGTVTVTARATADYVLAAGAVASWTGTFKATPFIATPAAVTFTDKDGTKDDTYTVPATTGVEYLVGGKVVAAGTYSGAGTVTVTARAKTDYVLAAGAVASWTGTFKATPFIATPAAVVFTDKDGTKDDTYTVPATTGVEYLVGGKVVAAGTYPGTGTVTVTARATADYVLAAGAVASWTGTFKATPFIATPAAVTFTDKDGTKDDVYVVPATTGVEYLVGGKVVAAGTYPGTGTVTVTARAKTDYVLASGATASWTATFKSTVPVSFTDVPAGAQFQSEISWLAAQGISTGWTETNGSRTFRPLQAVNRDAMAAFMYRLAGSPAFQAPAVSPFADVTPSTQFYKEITWLASKGISTGWVEANGTKTFRPVQPVNRDAMAAFMYRFAGKPVITGKATFADVPAGAQFQQEISWLAGSGISTGWTEASGSKTYRPLQPVNRDAMAAFMYRYHEKFSK